MNEHRCVWCGTRGVYGFYLRYGFKVCVNCWLLPISERDMERRAAHHAYQRREIADQNNAKSRQSNPSALDWRQSVG